MSTKSEILARIEAQRERDRQSLAWPKDDDRDDDNLARQIAQLMSFSAITKPERLAEEMLATLAGELDVLWNALENEAWLDEHAVSEHIYRLQVRARAAAKLCARIRQANEPRDEEAADAGEVHQ